MITKEKAMYQTWLIIEGLSEFEKKLISKDLIEEIKNGMEYDENIKIDFSIPLEKQKLDPKTWRMLDKVIKSAEQNGFERNKTVETSKKEKGMALDEYKIEEIKLENIALSEELKSFRNESKRLILEYREAYEQSKEENEKLKKDCEILIQTLNLIPRFIRRIFIKDENIKLLVSGKRKEEKYE